MKLFTLTLVTLMMSVSISSFSQTTYVDNGSSKSYNLQNGDSLYIKQGTFTGDITNWGGGGKVAVAVGATLKPGAVNGFRGKYSIYGTAVLPSIGSEAGFGLNNYGTLTINGGAQANGNTSQVWINNSGAILNIKGSFAFNSGANNSTFTNYGTVSVESSVAINANNITFVNSGTFNVGSTFAINGNANSGSFTNNGDIDIAGDFNVYGNVTILNNKSLVVDGNLNANKGTITNGGLFSSAGTLTLGGNVSYTNTCRTVADNGIKIDNQSANVYNSGLLWASNAKNASAFTNGGTLTNGDKGVIKTVEFTNNRTITGNGFLYITGKSTLNGQGKVGTNGNTQDSLKIYTVNRASNSQIFDNQHGTVYNNAKYAQFQAPDTTTASYYPCSAQYAPRILPVVWNAFSAVLSADIPVLNWSAQFDAGTYFEVERSNNAIDFASITKVAGQQNIVTYKYEDRTLPSTHASVVYYRIKATEPDGTNKYSDVKAVRFSNESNNSLQAWPNPFNSQLNVNYKSAQKAMLTIKIFNIDGGLQVVKTAAVNTGNNSIIIAEANRLNKGIYIVRISADNGITASSKIIKQ